MASERARRLKRLYTLTVEDYERILTSQGGACGSCGGGEVATTRSLAVDHDHRCCPGSGHSCGRCVRGLLCGGCNGLIGFYELCLTPAMERDQLDQYNAYLSRFAIPGRAPVPGRAGPRVRHPYLGEMVRVYYYPQWIIESAGSIYASIDGRIADLEAEVGSGQEAHANRARASIERLARQRQALDQFLATGRMPAGGIRVCRERSTER